MRGSMSRMARRRKASSTMLRRRVWSGSSMVSMLTASVRSHPGIHQRRPATLPSLRIVKVSLSFKTRPASSLVVVIQVLPMIGKRTSTTGPAARSLASPAAGSRRYSWLVKSKRSMALPPPLQQMADGHWTPGPQWPGTGGPGSASGPTPFPTAHGFLHGSTHHAIEFRHLLETRTRPFGRGNPGPGVQLRGERFEQAVLLLDHDLVVV